MIQLIGYLASLGAAVMWLPQTVRAVRLRRAGSTIDGLDTSAYLVAVVFNVLLVAYGWLNHAVPVVAAGTINLVCATIIVATKLGVGTETGKAEP